MVELKAIKLYALGRIYEIFKIFLNSIKNIFWTIHNLFIWTGLLSNISITLKKQPAEVSLTKKVPMNIRISHLINIWFAYLILEFLFKFLVYMTYYKLVSLLKYNISNHQTEPSFYQNWHNHPFTNIEWKLFIITYNL